MNIKVGHGIDIHQLKKNKPLILAGINIPTNIGIVGHSDGDIVIHAIVDAILGALSKGDIGTFFPSNKPEYKNCSSNIFLQKAIDIMKKENYIIGNIDINIVLQKPHINSYIESMKKSLSDLMQIDNTKISIKATTSDYLGFVGQGKGIISTATLLLLQNHES
tara:strand:- start:20 stop:508 length:489 start_codon:yes stop_codon:yes gene_type:complete